MTNIIIILPSLCCHYRPLNIEPHSINDTQPSYHARTHSQSIVVANVPRVSLFHTYSTMLLDSCLNGTILGATFHNNLIGVVAIQRSGRARYVIIFILQSSTTTNIVTFSHVYCCVVWGLPPLITDRHSIDTSSLWSLLCTNLLQESCCG